MGEEKQIEELTIVVIESGMLDTKSRCEVVAEEIYRADYRKQSETAEKFARAILKDVNHYSKDYKNPAFGSSWIENKVKEIAAQFGAKMK